jgi:hypothetical protein
VSARVAFTLVTGAGMAAYGAHVVFGFGGPGSDGFFQDWVYNGLVLSAALSCLIRGFVSRAERARWLSLGGGLLCLFGGELYYTLHLSHLANPPYPSLADGLYLAFYPAGYAALVLFAPRASRQLRACLWLDGLMSALGVGALAAAVLLQPIVASTGGARLEVATTLAYPLGDVTLLAFVVGLLALNAWKPSRSWTLIAAGLATMAVADSVFLWQSANGAYVEGGALDALWPAAALLLGHAAWQPSAREATRLEGWRLLAMPALFALIPVGLLVYGNLKPMNTLALTLGAAALVVAVVRMAYTFSNTLRVTAEATTAALTDSLTGLGNRRALLGELEQELTDAGAANSAVLVLFDLDGFKDYNDTFGHPAGDALLVRLGRRRLRRRLQARRRRVLRRAQVRPGPRGRRPGPRRRRDARARRGLRGLELPRHGHPARGGTRVGPRSPARRPAALRPEGRAPPAGDHPAGARRPAPDGHRAGARAA